MVQCSPHRRRVLMVELSLKLRQVTTGERTARSIGFSTFDHIRAAVIAYRYMLGLVQIPLT